LCGIGWAVCWSQTIGRERGTTGCYLEKEKTPRGRWRFGGRVLGFPFVANESRPGRAGGRFRRRAIVRAAAYGRPRRGMGRPQGPGTAERPEAPRPARAAIHGRRPWPMCLAFLCGGPTMAPTGRRNRGSRMSVLFICDRRRALAPANPPTPRGAGGTLAPRPSTSPHQPFFERASGPGGTRAQRIRRGAVHGSRGPP